MNRSNLSLLALGTAALAFGTGCDVSVVRVEDDAKMVADRDTSRLELDIHMLTTINALVDFEDPDDDWFDDRPWSELSVAVTAESKGILGLGIIDTVATAWVEDETGRLASSVSVWSIDKDAHSTVLFVPNPFGPCSQTCTETYTLVVAFDEEDARVVVDFEAELVVDYDEMLGSEPVVVLELDPVL